jgi:hypothetical protein
MTFSILRILGFEGHAWLGGLSCPRATAELAEDAPGF